MVIVFFQPITYKLTGPNKNSRQVNSTTQDSSLDSRVGSNSSYSVGLTTHPHTFRLSDAPMDSLVRMHQTVWRWDSGALHDCEEEVQKLPVYQLQRQERDQSVQCTPLLASKGTTPWGRIPDSGPPMAGWFVCLFKMI